MNCAGVGQRLEQPAPHDLEALLGAGGPPRGLDAADDVAQPIERLAPALAAHLDVVGLGVGRARGVRGREADHEQAVLHQLRRLGQHLGEGELRLEAARRQVALVVELAGVGHPLVDQDQARPVLVEQLAEHVAGAGRLLVVGLDAGERLLAAELPGQLAPERAHHGAVGLGGGIAGRDLVAHQHHAPGGRQRLGARLLHHRVDAHQLRGRDAREQVVERQHRVRLAAAEVGLELHDRVAALAGEAPHRAHQHPLEALGEIGAAEELDGVLVLVRPLAEVHLPEVGGELGLLVAAAGDVLVRRHHLAPGLEAARRRALDRGAGALALLAPRLLVEAKPQELRLHLLDVVGLRRRDGGQQAAGRVERAIGVVAGEGLLVRPPVAMVAELADQAALGGPERQAEDVVPGFPHELEQRRHVHCRRSASSRSGDRRRDTRTTSAAARSLHVLLNSRSTNGPSPPLRSSIALPTRSWLVMATGYSSFSSNIVVCSARGLPPSRARRVISGQLSTRPL